MFKTVLLYYHTLRYLRWTQVKYRIYYLLRNYFGVFQLFSKKSQEIPSSYEKLNLEKSLPPASSVKYSSLKFSFLNLEKQFLNSINWNEDCYGKLWTYNLNYFEFLHIPTLPREEGITLIRDFVKNISSIKDGLEPYPISLRVVHWTKFLTYHNINDREIDQSLYHQLTELVDKLEYHILGNHLLENGFALLFGAYYFNEDAFFQKAKKILVEELEEQILDDGAHFELSPMYHQLMFFRVLDGYNLIKNNTHFSQELLMLFSKKAELMLGWLNQISFLNGDIPLFNDSTQNINPKTKDLNKYAERLKIKPLEVVLNASGYRKLKKENFELIVDVGHIGPDYIPGHSHSDTLGFVLNIKNEPIIVDTGISTYEKNEIRHLERSTFSHNTVQVENWEQSEIWGGFRVAKRAYATIHNESKNHIIASHSGYQRKGITHQRKFSWENTQIRIEDSIDSKVPRKAYAYFHFHPTTKIKVFGNKILINNSSMLIENADQIDLVEFMYAGEFNKRVPSNKLIISFSNNLKTTITI
jgi:hypothetical protein